MHYQMDYMYTPVCLNIDETKCPKPGDPFYTERNYGFGNLVFISFLFPSFILFFLLFICACQISLILLYNFFISGREVLDNYLKNNKTISFEDPQYVKFRFLAGLFPPLLSSPLLRHEKIDAEMMKKQK